MKKLKHQTNTTKQNYPIDIFHKTKEEFNQKIDEWKQNTDRQFLTDMTNFLNHQKMRTTSRSRISTSQSILGVQNRKNVNAFEILKQQAIFLDSQNFNYKKTQYMNTQPIQRKENTNIKNIFLRTSNDKLFKGQQLRSVLQNKRGQIKNIRKIDFSKSPFSFDKKIKFLKTNLLEQIYETNKPIIVYPFMDSIYQQQIKQRLNASILNGKRQLRKQRNRSVSTNFIQCLAIEKKQSKTTYNWKNKINDKMDISSLKNQ